MIYATKCEGAREGEKKYNKWVLLAIDNVIVTVSLMRVCVYKQTSDAFPTCSLFYRQLSFPIRTLTKIA